MVDLLGEIEEGDRDGVRVNERRVRIAPLGSKDILTIGRFRVEPRFSRRNFPPPWLTARAVPDSNSDSRRLILGTDEIDFPHEFESRLAALTATHHAEIERSAASWKTFGTGWRNFETNCGRSNRPPI